jgi:hypothetical protein
MNFLSVSLLCGCAPQTVLDDIDISEVKFGQITRFAIQKLGTANAVADITATATLTTLAGAADATKILLSPIVHNPTPSIGAAIEYGSGNAVNGGVPILVGTQPSSLELELLNARQDTATDWNKLNCTEVGVIFYDRCGNALGIADAVSNVTTISPIPLSYIFASQMEFGGLEAPNKNMVKLGYKDVEWSKNVGVAPSGTFNPIADLL